MSPSGPRSPARTAFFLAVAFIATAPAWIVRHPPLQDLPTHLATLRVVHSFSDPAFGFKEHFTLDLFSTHYLLYYLIGSAFAYVLGVVKANVLLMCLYLGGTVLAMRELLVALGKDERLAILVMPLLVNVMWLLGFLPFLLGLPMAFYGIAAAIRHFEKPTRKTAIVLGVVAFFLFVMHLFPYALFGIAFAALFPWGRPRQWLGAGLPVVPSLALLAVWMAETETAHKSVDTLKGQNHIAALDAALTDAPRWSINVFRDTSDEKWFIVLAFVVVVIIALSQGDRDASKPIARRYAVVPLVLAFLYFTTGEYIGEVWLFAQRFPILALITAIPLLRMPKGPRGVAATALALAVGVGAIVNVCKHYIEFEKDEVGDFEDAIATMDPAKNVAGLVFDKGSGVVNLAPFLHFPSYYQVEKGGFIQFSIANITYSPFHYRPDRLPPEGSPARLRWEWTPEQVTVQELFPYYDYVLVRGSGFHPPAGTYHSKFRGSRWQVWEKDSK